MIKNIHNNFYTNLKEILKVPIELYDVAEFERVEKMIQTEEILIHIYNKLKEIDLITIFREEIQKPNFDFEKFMMSPNIYNILSIYVTNLFNSFAGVNTIFSLELKEFRETLWNHLGFMKSEYNLMNANFYRNLIKFVYKFFKLFNFEIPLEKCFDFNQETQNFQIQIDMISSKTFLTLVKIMSKFESSGLIRYMQKDFPLSEYELRNLKSLECTKEDYLVLDEGNQIDKHVKLNYLKKFVEDNNQNLGELLNKKRKYEKIEDELQLSNKIKGDKIKQMMPKKINTQIKISSVINSGSLSFIPDKISYISK